MSTFVRLSYTAAFSYLDTPAIFRNKLTSLFIFEQSSLARNGQLEELFIYFVKYECKYLLCI